MLNYRLAPSTKALALGLLVFGAFSASAAPSDPASDRISAERLGLEETAIKADPSHWFTTHKGTLAKSVRDIVAADPAFAAVIVAQHYTDVVAKTPGAKDQGAAIGAGLGQAMLGLKDHVEDAAKIQTAASSSQEASLVTSFFSTIGSAQTGSIGSGSGGGSGGEGSGSGIGGPAGPDVTQRLSASAPETETGGGTPNRSPNLLVPGDVSSISGLTPGSSTSTTTIRRAARVTPTPPTTPTTPITAPTTPATVTTPTTTTSTSGNAAGVNL